ncbi:ABC transporter permease [Lacrimispora algidixylanolytica]|uniref:ABC transporter permease n=1 Tax=Lacrimispora algidixylanolytica TaxID=94868 RepID=A0A419T0F3_9FIRM|nr:ABC transporter permease [Lacrimispora algidixylanolytica]RKD31050.1 ABC transporter permease [Lacrimispora algidixylanolytica]
MLIENMSMAFHAIRANKMRSFLTMLGIIIGIGAVIAIAAVGDSMRNLFTDAFKDVGLNRAAVMVSWEVDDFRMSDQFTRAEMDRIKDIFSDRIEYIDSNASNKVEAVNGRRKVSYQFQGVDYNYTDVQPLDIVYGRFLNESDVKGAANHVVLEDKGAIKLFGTADSVGRTFRMTLNKITQEYKVVGVYHKDMSPMVAMMLGNGQSQSGFIPDTVLTRSNDTFQAVNLYSRNGTNMRQLTVDLKQYVAKLKGRPESEIMAMSAVDQMGTMDAQLGTMSAAVGGIAAISLLVGGIGIMNIMMVSVTERTREIGIRKALGARTKDIMIQFLTESALMSACGGIIGVILGISLVKIGGTLLKMTVVVNPAVIVLAVGFSALVGIFFGLYPASKAANADPIEALRFE